ncbi:MAG: hypothetical protein ABIS23_06725 [Sphingomicrobium sp.]
MNGALEQQSANVAEALVARVATVGCEADPYLGSLGQEGSPNLGLDLADAVHMLCSLHGHYPGLIAIAETRSEDAFVRSWLAVAGEAFERERALLLRLTAAVGPIPSTPGAAESESSLAAARHALETLAHSERSGCAVGAACALVADWQPIRRMLNRAAWRSGIDTSVPDLPDTASLQEIITYVAAVPAAARALGFGSEQLLLQHRAVFSLLEARSESRRDF